MCRRSANASLQATSIILRCAVLWTRILRVLARGLFPMQTHMLLAWAGHVKDFDPSVGGESGFERVMEKWGHLLQHVPVQDLLWTHDSINPKFRNQQGLFSLYYDLRGGRTRVDKLCPIVVVRYMGRLWCITGNRRLMNLEYYQRESASVVLVPCLVHDISEAPKEVMAKLVLASTTIDGREPRVRPAKRNRRYGQVPVRRSISPNMHPPQSDRWMRAVEMQSGTRCELTKIVVQSALHIFQCLWFVPGHQAR